MASCCGPASGMPAQQGASEERAPASSASANSLHLVDIQGGRVRIGAMDPEGFASDGEGPGRFVEISPYRISATTVTNAEFSLFVSDTGYRTEAEQAGESFVFALQWQASSSDIAPRPVAGLPWWLSVSGACWRAPHGPGSDWRSLADHPVVHVSWHDAIAYCRWAGVALPTEAQWENAARGGLVDCRYPWGNEFQPEGAPRCNTWRGRFPDAPDAGWNVGTVPADAFEPNGFGLYNTSGNVWEWCADWFHADYHRKTESIDPFDERPGDLRSQRGGSFLCHDSYCNRYRNPSRGANSPSSATSHTGFRVVALR